VATIQIQNVWIEDEGEGEAVLCIHGLGGSSNCWTPLLSAFAGRRVIRPDLPGSGRSALAQQMLSIDLYVDTVVSVLQELDMACVDVVAHSMGTIVAQHLAVKHPDRVKSLALFGPLTAPPDAGRDGIRQRAQLARNKGVAGLQEIADAIVNAATSEETKRDRPVTVALVRESIMRQSAEGYAQSCEALAEAQAAEIDRITVPTLLVTGEQDGVAKPDAVRAMAARIAQAKLVIYPGCGHWTTFEKPGQSRADLEAFYRTV